MSKNGLDYKNMIEFLIYQFCFKKFDVLWLSVVPLQSLSDVRFDFQTLVTNSKIENL